MPPSVWLPAFWNVVGSSPVDKPGKRGLSAASGLQLIWASAGNYATSVSPVTSTFLTGCYILLLVIVFPVPDTASVSLIGL